MKLSPVPEGKYFDHHGFWSKVNTFYRRSGRYFIEQSLILYYVSQDEEVPIWAKLLIYSALIYFVSPIDAIPDMFPFGLSDDIAVLTAAIGAVSAFIGDEIKQEVNNKLWDIFGK